MSQNITTTASTTTPAIVINRDTDTNALAELIGDYRYIAASQLLPSDLGRKDWKKYRKICTRIVDNAMAIYSNATDTTEFDNNLTELFDLFGGLYNATRGISKYRVRIALSCIQQKKQRSDAFKDVCKQLTDAKKERDKCENAITDGMTKDTHPALFYALDDAKAKVDEIQATKDEMAAEPHNVWWDAIPLKSKNDKELALARKHIEDTLFDIILERKNMTENDHLIEKGQLNGGRKVAEQIAKAEKAAQAQ